MWVVVWVRLVVGVVVGLLLGLWRRLCGGPPEVDPPPGVALASPLSIAEDEDLTPASLKPDVRIPIEDLAARVESRTLIRLGRTEFFAALSAGQGFGITTDAHGRLGGELQMNSIYLDSSVSAEKAQVTYLQRTGSN